MIWTRPSTDEDLEFTLDHLRETDRVEMAGLGQSPHEGVYESVGASEWVVSIVDHDDEVLAISGFAEREDVGIPWLVGTHLIASNKVGFLRETRKIVQRMRGEPVYVLQNYADATNHSSLRWLESLGFEVIRDKMVTSFGGTYFKFRMKLCVQ